MDNGDDGYDDDDVEDDVDGCSSCCLDVLLFANDDEAVALSDEQEEASHRQELLLLGLLLLQSSNTFPLWFTRKAAEHRSGVREAWMIRRKWKAVIVESIGCVGFPLDCVRPRSNLFIHRFWILSIDSRPSGFAFTTAIKIDFSDSVLVLVVFFGAILPYTMGYRIDASAVVFLAISAVLAGRANSLHIPLVHMTRKSTYHPSSSSLFHATAGNNNNEPPDSQLEQQQFTPTNDISLHEHLHVNGKPQHDDTTALQDDFAGKHPRKHQLWLDLRGTAILPHEAVQFLEELLLDDDEKKDDDDENDTTDRPLLRTTSWLVDGVLVPEALVDRVVARWTTMNDDDELHEPGRNPYSILYTTTTDQLVWLRPNAPPSVVGRTVQVEKGGVPDPAMAVDTVMEQHNWLLLEDIGDGAEAMQAAQIPTLLQVLSSSSSFATTTTESGLWWGTPAVPGGGIAIQCNDFLSFVAVDATIAEMTSTAQLCGTSRTESGLLVPAASTKEAATDAESTIPSTALLLPLDLSIWRDVLEIRGLPEREQECGERDQEGPRQLP